MGKMAQAERMAAKYEFWAMELAGEGQHEKAALMQKNAEEIYQAICTIHRGRPTGKTWKIFNAAVAKRNELDAVIMTQLDIEKAAR